MILRMFVLSLVGFLLWGVYAYTPSEIFKKIVNTPLPSVAMFKKCFEDFCWTNALNYSDFYIHASVDWAKGKECLPLDFPCNKYWNAQLPPIPVELLDKLAKLRKENPSIDPNYICAEACDKYFCYGVIPHIYVLYRFAEYAYEPKYDGEELEYDWWGFWKDNMDKIKELFSPKEAELLRYSTQPREPWGRLANFFINLRYPIINTIRVHSYGPAIRVFFEDNSTPFRKLEEHYELREKERIHFVIYESDIVLYLPEVWQTVYKQYNEGNYSDFTIRPKPYKREREIAIPYKPILQYNYTDIEDVLDKYFKVQFALYKITAPFGMTYTNSTHFKEKFEEVFGINPYDVLIRKIEPYKYTLLKRWIELPFEGIRELEALVKEIPKDYYKYYPSAIIWKSVEHLWNKTMKALKEGKEYVELPQYFTARCVKFLNGDEGCLPDDWREDRERYLPKDAKLIYHKKVKDWVGFEYEVWVYEGYWIFEDPELKKPKHPRTENLILSLLPVRRSAAPFFKDDILANNYVCAVEIGNGYVFVIPNVTVYDGMDFFNDYVEWFAFRVFIIYNSYENYAIPELKKVFGQKTSLWEMPVAYWGWGGLEFPLNSLTAANYGSRKGSYDNFDSYAWEKLIPYYMGFGYVYIPDYTLELLKKDHELAPWYIMFMTTPAHPAMLPPPYVLCWPKPKGSKKKEYVEKIVQEILTGEYENETEFLIHVADYLNYLILDVPELFDAELYKKIELARIYAYYGNNTAKAKELLREVVREILDKKKSA